MSSNTDHGEQASQSDREEQRFRETVSQLSIAAVKLIDRPLREMTRLPDEYSRPNIMTEAILALYNKFGSLEELLVHGERLPHHTAEYLLMEAQHYLEALGDKINPLPANPNKSGPSAPDNSANASPGNHTSNTSDPAWVEAGKRQPRLSLLGHSAAATTLRAGLVLVMAQHLLRLIVHECSAATSLELTHRVKDMPKNAEDWASEIGAFTRYCCGGTPELRFVTKGTESVILRVRHHHHDFGIRYPEECRVKSSHKGSNNEFICGFKESSTFLDFFLNPSTGRPLYTHEGAHESTTWDFPYGAGSGYDLPYSEGWKGHKRYFPLDGTVLNGLQDEWKELCEKQIREKQIREKRMSGKQEEKPKSIRERVTKIFK